MSQGVQTSVMGSVSNTLMSVPMLLAGFGADIYAGKRFEDAGKILSGTKEGRAFLSKEIANQLPHERSSYLFRRMGRSLPFGKEFIDDVGTARFSAAKETVLGKIASGSDTITFNRGIYREAMKHAGANSGAFRSALREATNIKALTSFTMGFATAAMAYDVGKATANYFANKGREVINKIPGMGGNGFMDTNMAYTTRQRALRAIQNSQSGHRRALGNESAFLHEYR